MIHYYNLLHAITRYHRTMSYSVECLAIQWYLYIPVPNREEAANRPRHTTRQASVCLLLALFPGSSPGLDVSF